MFVVGMKDVDHLLFHQAPTVLADGSRPHENAAKIGTSVRAQVVQTLHPVNTAGSRTHHAVALGVKARAGFTGGVAQVLPTKAVALLKCQKGATPTAKAARTSGRRAHGAEFVIIC